MRKFLDLLYTVSGGAAAFSLACLALIVMGQVVFNLINAAGSALFGVNYGLLIPSYASFSGYALAFATFLSLGLGFRKAVHIRITLLESRLGVRTRRGTLTLVACVGSLMGLLFSYSLVELAYESWMWGDTASGLIRIPLWMPQSLMALGAIIFMIACLDTLIEMLVHGRSEAFKEDFAVEEESIHD